MGTQNLLGLGFCQNQAAELQLWLTLISHTYHYLSMDIEYLSLVWLSDIWASGPNIVRVQKDIRLTLLINKTVTLIVTGHALGFFTGSGILIPFSIDLSGFCRSFRVECKTTIQSFISHDVLLINEVHNVIETYSFSEILATIWYKIISWTQNRMFCKLLRTIKRDLGFILAAHRFLQRQEFFNFDEVEHWILIKSRYWWETSPVVGYVRS